MALCGLLLAFFPLLGEGSLYASDLAIDSSAVADPNAAALEEGLAIWSQDQLQEGVWPTWFRYCGWGAHLPRHAAAAALHPIRAPFLFGGEDGLALFYVLRLALALAGVYLLAVRLGLRPEAAALAGLIFALSAPLMRQIHMAELDAAVLLPWFFVAVDWLARTRRPQAFLALCLAGLGILLGGGLAYALAAVVGTGLLAWFRSARHRAYLGEGLSGGGLSDRDRWDRDLVGLGLLVVLGLGFGLLLTGAGTASKPGPGLLSALAGVGFDHPLHASPDRPGLAHAVAPMVLVLASLSGMRTLLVLPLAGALLCAVLGPYGRGGVALSALVLALAAADGWMRWDTLSLRQRQPGLIAVACLLLVSGLAATLCSGMDLDWFCIVLTVLVAGIACLAALSLGALPCAFITALSLLLMQTWSFGEAQPEARERPAFVGPLLQHRASGGRFVSLAQRPDLRDCVRYGLADLRPWPGLSRRQDRLFESIRARLLVGETKALRAGFDPEAVDRAVLDVGNLRYLIGTAEDGYPVTERETLPFAFFPKRTAKADSEGSLEYLLQPGFDPESLTILETQEVGVGPPSGVASIARKQVPGELRLRAQCSAEAWLYVALEPGPWLIAEVDGERVPVVRANYVGAAVRVPRGRHELRLYAQGSIGPGIWGSLLALASLLWALGRMLRNPKQEVDREPIAGQTVPPQLPHGGYSSVG